MPCLATPRALSNYVQKNNDDDDTANTGNDNNQEDDRLLKSFVAELMWLASVDCENKCMAAENRRFLLARLLAMLELRTRRGMAISHNQIYGQFNVIGMEANAMQYLRSHFMVSFMVYFKSSFMPSFPIFYGLFYGLFYAVFSLLL